MYTRRAPNWLSIAVTTFISLTALSSVNFTTASTSNYDWLQWNGNAQHSGNNTHEKLINISSVRRLRKLFQVKLPAVADGAPVGLTGVTTSVGVKNLIFLTTKVGHLIALDAQTGTPIWTQVHLAGSCVVEGTSGSACFTTSMPAIDPDRQFIYTYGLDGYAHKHSVADGKEITGAGWPELVTAKPTVEKSSPGLTIATARSGINYLYVTNSAYQLVGDYGDYQGHVTAINLSDGTQKVFNALCSNLTGHLGKRPNTLSCEVDRAGIWGRAGVVYSPDTDRIYFSTGNATFNPMRHHWGNSVLALNPDGSGANDGPIDSYTPTNYQDLDDDDQDLASSAPLILSTPPNSKIKHLAVQGGKDSKLRLINLDDLSGKGKPGEVGGEVAPIHELPQNKTHLTTSPATWINPQDGTTWVFEATYFGLSGWQLTVDLQGNPNLELKWQNNKPSTSPIVVNGVLFAFAFKNIYAFDPVTGQLVWGDYPIGNSHWQSPVVMNGVLYITDESANLTAYTVN